MGTNIKPARAGFLLPVSAVNHKRVDRLYALEKLHLKRRRRKKIPLADRQPLVRPTAPDQVWSMDFIFDRIADGRGLKCLVVVLPVA